MMKKSINARNRMDKRIAEKEVTLEKIRNNVGLGKAIATVDGKKACTAELTFMIG